MAIDWDAHLHGPVHAVFGGALTYLPRGGAAFEMTDAIFDEAHLAVTMLDDQTPASTSNPVVGVRLAAFPPGLVPRQSDRVRIAIRGRLETFVIEDVQKDGHGWAKLPLTFVKKEAS